MNRRIFFKRASQALAGVAASLAIGKFVEPKLLWEGDRSNVEYFSYSTDWVCGRTAPGGVWAINAQMDGGFHHFSFKEVDDLYRALISRNYQPHMSVAFAYNVKTKELKLTRLV